MIGRIAAAAYVGTVAGLTAYAFRSPDVGFGRAEATAGILTLPAIVPALPVIYVVGALAWQVDAMWVVTLTFSLMMAATAVANLLLLRLLRRAPSGSAAAGASSPGRPTRGAATTPTRPGLAGSS